jgi:hypothetical protein
MSNEELKIRVLNAKKNLPKSGVTSLFFHCFKTELKKTPKTYVKLNNVLQLRVTDEDYTCKLEILAVKLDFTNKLLTTKTK